MVASGTTEDRMRIPLPLTIAALVAGCDLGAGGAETGDTDDTGCWCCDVPVVEHSDTLEVDAEAYATALGDDGAMSEAECLALCKDTVEQMYQWVEGVSCADAGPTAEGGAIDCTYKAQSYCEGRASAAVDGPAEGSGPDALAAWLARAARAEAASVTSFLHLARELEAHGAPPELIRRARRAAADEVRHARVMGAFAAAHGGRAAAPGAVPLPARPLEALAVENAVEGCVGETWAAVVAAWQGRHAADAELRAAMRRIAADEAEHAELAWAIDDWLRARLDAPAIARVDAARRAAADALIAATDVTPAPDAVGSPTGPVARRLATRLFDALIA